MHTCKAGNHVITFDGQVVERFNNRQMNTVRFHVEHIIEAHVIDQKRGPTIRILAFAGPIDEDLDDDQRPAAEALIAAVNEALANLEP